VNGIVIDYKRKTVVLDSCGDSEVWGRTIWTASLAPEGHLIIAQRFIAG